MKTVILSGGIGSRLRDVVKDVPKPMADINGRPFLEYLTENMINYGADEFIFCVGYKKEVIQDYFKDNYKGIPVKYSIEEELLGTGGAIRQAFDLFNIDNAVIINGDTFVKMDYAQFYKDMKGEKLGLALKYVDNASRYGLVENENVRVVNFCEKKDTVEAGFINAGIYYIDKTLFNKDLPKKFSFEKDILEKEIKNLKPKFYRADDYFIDIGIPDSYKQAVRELKYHIKGKQKALFLDRDGVINIDKHHVYKIEDCEFVDGIFDLCKKAKSEDYLLIVVTNQAGIAKGIYTEEDYFKFRDYVHSEFEKHGCPIDAEYYCPYHKEAVIEKYKQESYDRKPNPGMILKAQKDFNIDLSKSILIGDKESDIQAGKTANIGRLIKFEKDTDNLLLQGLNL